MQVFSKSYIPKTTIKTRVALMNKEQKICLIDTFRETLYEKNQQSFFSHNDYTDAFEIDRFLLKDILHLLNHYEREIIKDDL